MNDCKALLDLDAGRTGIVTDCSGGRACLSRLAAMGFTPGSRVTVVNNHRFGPVLVLVHGSRIALGRGEAAQVLVRPEEGGNGAVTAESTGTRAFS